MQPLPRLVVIVDEFASLAAELPDFVSSLVDAIGEAARTMGYMPPRKPWLPPLPGRLTDDELERAAGDAGDEARWFIPLGLADEPSRQRQVVAGWDPARGNLLVCGTAGSGTTTMLTTLALFAARRFSPADLHL